MKFLILISLLFSTIVLANKKPSIKVGQVIYPPYFTESFDGILNKKIENILSSFEVRWLNIPLPRAIKHLNNGDIDINTSLVKVKERLNILDFSSEPIVSISPAFCSTEKKKTLLKDDLKTMLNLRNVLIPKGSHLKYELNVLKAQTKFTEIAYKGNYTERAIKMLKLNRVDLAFFPEKQSFEERARQMKIHCLQSFPKRHLHFSFKKGNPLKAKIDGLM